MDDLKIAFVSKYQFENDAFRGAVLVTDGETKPLEFRVTDSIRPTKIQRTLYGEILYDYILVELIAVPLLDALEEKPSFVLVNDEIFLEANSKREIPVIRISKKENIAYRNEQYINQEIKNSPKFEDLRITTSQNIQQSKLSSIQNKLAIIHMYKDLLEPFQRIEKACNQLEE